MERKVEVTLLEQAATRLNIVPEILERESLQAYLERSLRFVESELFMLAQRFGVQTVAEFDKAIQSGRFHEKDSFEEFFRFDYLENERQTLRELLEQL
jgi:hypothetical protein